jgi:hypothetical protein
MSRTCLASSARIGRMVIPGGAVGLVARMIAECRPSAAAWVRVIV